MPGTPWAPSSWRDEGEGALPAGQSRGRSRVPQPAPLPPAGGVAAVTRALPSRVPGGACRLSGRGGPGPVVAPNAYIVQVLAFAGLNVMMAVGLNLLMGYAGQVSLGHAGFYGLGAYVSAVLGARFGLSPWLGMPLAAVRDRPARLRGRHAHAPAQVVLPGHGHPRHRHRSPPGLRPALLVDGGLVRTGRHSALRHRAAALRQRHRPLLPDLDSSPPPRCGSPGTSSTPAWAASLRALGDSEVAAEAMGVDTAREKRRMFVLSAVYASVAGSLYAHYITVISPEIFSFLFSVLLSSWSPSAASAGTGDRCWARSC